MAGFGHIRKYIVPAAVFQSVIFGGAYGTGREIAEFISRHGPTGGLLALLIICIGFTSVMYLSFEIARRFKVYDYRRFLKTLIGPGWIAFEVLFLIAVLLVLAVNGAAVGTILEEQFSIRSMVGVGILFLAVVLLNFFGRVFIERSMSFCMIGLTVVLAIFCVQTLLDHGAEIATSFRESSLSSGWVVNGLQYTMYNAAVIPVLLFCARDLTSSRESFIGALIAGLAGTFPALIFHLTFMTDFPAILEQPLPVYEMLKSIAGPVLFITYIVVLVAMIIQTVAGLLHGLNERLDSWAIERRGESLSKRSHALVAAGVLVTSLLIAQFGITAIIAKGYGTLAWGYLIVFLVPLFTVGIRLLLQRPPAAG